MDKASRCGREDCRIVPGRSPTYMNFKVFLFKKISTMTGIIILISITLLFGAMVSREMKELMSIRVGTISSLEE